MRERILLWGQKLIVEGKWSFLFAPVSFFWYLTVLCKNTFYRKSFFRKTKLQKAVVVSIGNIVAGGTGKTPFTRKLAKHFSKRKVAILLRGYGKDEAILHAKTTKVYVGKDRVTLARQAEEVGYELILIDDGFQYQKLEKDVDVVLVRGDDPFGKGHFLPWGMLRDHPKRLKDADALFVKDRDFRLKVIGMEREEKEVGIFTAIANPLSFKQTVSSLGKNVRHEKYLFDHAEFPESELQKFIDECKSLGCKEILTTEKDYVKLEKKVFSLPIFCVEIEVEMIGKGKHKWKKLVAQIEEKIDNLALCQMK